jgi:leader peptidase (prepilin peptidase)/N-methyltransferase
MPDTTLIPTWLLLAVAGVIGACIGSFLTVVTHRVPARVSVVTPRSACTWCGRTLRARELVPVLSWLLQRGRCARCGVAVSPRYPLIETASAALAMVAAALGGPVALAAALTGLIGITWIRAAHARRHPEDGGRP